MENLLSQPHLHGYIEGGKLAGLDASQLYVKQIKGRICLSLVKMPQAHCLVKTSGHSA